MTPGGSLFPGDNGRQCRAVPERGTVQLLPGQPPPITAFVRSCLQDFTASLCLEAPFVQLGLRPGAINVYAITGMKISLCSAQPPDSCVLWGFAYVLIAPLPLDMFILG